MEGIIAKGQGKKRERYKKYQSKERRYKKSLLRKRDAGRR